MNVEEVQRRLWEQSQEHRRHRESGRPLFPVDPYEKRSRNLMDLMHNPKWLSIAAERALARSERKACGVDRVTVAPFRENLETNLETLRLELKHGTYRPRPVRQVLIPKANGKMRALGIPCLRDKIVQEAMRMALEPIFEAEFHDSSFGFRPNRNTHHAVSRCQILMNRKFAWVIEGDIKACFDEIPHQTILRTIREKVMDNKFLTLIDLFLKAGVTIRNEFHATTRGVPQGGVISPLLANAVLNKLDWFLHEKGSHGNTRERACRNGWPNVRFVRYADDWVVFITRSTKRHAERLKGEIAEFLRRECGLGLSAEKTRVTHVRDGFDFLGFHLRCGIGKGGIVVPKIDVGTKAIRSVTERLRKVIRQVPGHVSISARIYQASLIVRGWAEYYKIAYDFAKIGHRLDDKTFWIMVNAIKRKEDISTGKCMRRYRRKGTICFRGVEYLRRFCDTAMSKYNSSPEPYIPNGKSFYESDVELEQRLTYIYEDRRPGSRDAKLTQLMLDENRCVHCGCTVGATDSQCHHKKEVNRFANFRMATYAENLETLCLRCHDLVHGRGTSGTSEEQS